MTLIKYVVIRILLMIPTLFGVISITFLIIQFVPGGPVEHYLAMQKLNATGEVSTALTSKNKVIEYQTISEEQVEAIKKIYGFDQPLLTRYAATVKNLILFDFGVSYYQQGSVASVILTKLPVSISLGVWTFLLTYLFAIPLGISKAIRAGSVFDNASTTLLLIMYSVPGFILAIALIALFGGGGALPLFPLRGITSDNWEELTMIGKLLDYLWHIFLPIVCLSLSGFAFISLLTKNSILDEVEKQYVLIARAKGLTESKVFYRHLLPNASIPILTGFPTQFLFAFFSGNLLIEIIFSLDGLGLLGYEAAINRDYPILLALIFLFSIVALVGKLITDILYIIVDPRINFNSHK
ncbi:MAG: ABC transporter permease subunit [Methylacidiphilales bacterium]|nr:ABC transporter permease subunit [Candidatus Methylacidiphilales bacterium]